MRDKEIKRGLSPIIASLLTSIKLILDSKKKKWAFFSIIFFLVLSMDDYSVFSLSVPPLNMTNTSEGFLQVVTAIGGKRGGGDKIFLSNDYHREEFRCRINSGDSSSCITYADARFFDKKIGAGGVLFFTPKAIDKTKYARVWWYEASFFGPLKEKRLLQLDIDSARVIDYEQQRVIYHRKKSHHIYLPTILFVFSVIYFCLLQFVNQSLNINKEK